MVARSREVEVMIRAAERAGESLLSDFARPDLLDVREKAASDFVSNADLRSQALLRGELASAFPDHGLVLEEGDDRASVRGARFIVDPLDGTTNFVHSIPHFAVAIALEVDGEVVAGVVFDPAKRELFWAQAGCGAWLGQRRLAVSSERELGRTVIGTGIPHNARGNHPPYLEALASIMRDVAGIRRFGAAALDLAYVAAGRFEAFFETGLAPWDVAAGALFVREAGGFVSRTDGRIEHLSGDVLAASSEALHAEMVRRLAPLHRSSAGAS
jgi:myo-inositol-1(or 4)-monophosphatase